MHYISTITTKIMRTMGKPMAIKKNILQIQMSDL